MFVSPLLRQARPFSIFWRISRPRMRAPAHMRLVTNIPTPRVPPCLIPFDSPLTAGALRRLAEALPQNLINSTHGFSLASTSEKTKSASVLIALSNVNGRPGIILEVRGKLRTHSGEIRCNFCFYSSESYPFAHWALDQASRAEKWTRCLAHELIDAPE
jgi:hypothetical protein